MKVPVLLPNIFDYPFTYDTELNLKVGDYVLVPFGKSKMTGVVWNEFEKQNNKKFLTKKVIKKLNAPSLNYKTLNFLNWFSNYNLVPKGMSLKLHMLSSQIVENLNEEEYQIYRNLNQPIKYNLSIEQKNSLREMMKIKNKFRVHLLQGTTGSGKTIVYFNAIRNKLEKNYQALILLPEIGLTSEFEKKFKDFFGIEPAIWHSGISKKKKKIIWSGLALGKIKVVIGARSALFLPFKKLGLIVVDEEHDQSFKQDEGVIYNARDMAIARAKFENIPVNLITAIPSIETYENVKKKKYFHSRLIQRYKKAKLPKHEIIDLNKYKLGKQSWISSKTLDKVKYHLSKGDQILFFLNRRGFSPFVLCKNCHKVFSCPNCSINLVYHKKKDYLLCHYCGFKSNLERKCNENENCKYVFTGPGVERIFEEVKRILPEYKSLIFSSDTMNKKSSKDFLKKITDNEINILIGTQLISKGFHFPNLNCIVVLDIDLSSLGHDLRGAEKNLQLYHQLSGRAGRTGKPANVYFQTYNLKSELIDQITNQDPFEFLDRELNLRKKNNLPPYERFVSLILTSTDEIKLEKESLKLRDKLAKEIDAKILGPVNAPIYRIKKKYRNRLLIRSRKTLNIQKKLHFILKNFNFNSGIKLTVDVDPINFN
tara:strand:+ start:2121 stop:4076 length:1956 start_codon:yes stop_codon:yes gene_type:complete